MARRSRTKKQKASSRKLLTMLSAPKPEPSAEEIVAASHAGNAVMMWYTYGG